MLLDTRNHIVHHFFRPLRLPRVAGVHVPVKILEARVLHRLGQEGHDALAAVAADQIGAAAGEPHQGGFHAGIVIDDGLHFHQVVKVGLGAGIEFSVVMVYGVDANAVAPFDNLPHHIAAAGAYHKEGGLGAVGVQHIQKLRRIGAGTIVEGQVDHLPLRIDRVLPGLHRHLHIPGDYGCILTAVRHRVGDGIGARRQPVHFPLHLHHGRHVAVHVVRGGKARLFIAGAQGDDVVFPALQLDFRQNHIPQGNFPLGYGGIAGGIRNGVGHKPRLFCPNHPVCNVAIVIIGGGKARLLIDHALHQRPLRVLLQGDGRGFRVDDPDLPPGFRRTVQKLRRIGYGILAKFPLIQVSFPVNFHFVGGIALL